MFKRTYTVIPFGEWNKSVNEAYGTKNYNVVTEERCADATYIPFFVKRDSLNRFLAAALVEWREGRKSRSPGLYTVYTDLANSGVLEEGHYLLEVVL